MGQLAAGRGGLIEAPQSPWTSMSMRPGDDQDTYWTAWWFEPVGKKAAGRVLDGRIHHDFPRMQELADVA